MNTHDDDLLRRHLASLRDPAPSADLFVRIERSRTQRRRRRHRLRAAAVAALVLAAVLPLRSLLAPSSAPMAVPMGELAPPDADEVALRRIDRQLQAAYDRGADSATLEALWLARERAAVQPRSPETADASVISL